MGRSRSHLFHNFPCDERIARCGQRRTVTGLLDKNCNSTQGTVRERNPAYCTAPPTVQQHRPFQNLPHESNKEHQKVSDLVSLQRIITLNAVSCPHIAVVYVRCVINPKRQQEATKRRQKGTFSPCLNDSGKVDLDSKEKVKQPLGELKLEQWFW